VARALADRLAEPLVVGVRFEIDQPAETIAVVANQGLGGQRTAPARSTTGRRFGELPMLPARLERHVARTAESQAGGVHRQDAHQRRLGHRQRQSPPSASLAIATDDQSRSA